MASGISKVSKTTPEVMRNVVISLFILIKIKYCVTNPLAISKNEKQGEDAEVIDIHLDDSDQISKFLADSWYKDDPPANGDENKERYFLWPYESTFIDNNIVRLFLPPKQATSAKVSTYLTTISAINPKSYVKDQIKKFKNAYKYYQTSSSTLDKTTKKAKKRRRAKNQDHISTNQVETTTIKTDNSEYMVSIEGNTTTDTIKEYTGTIEILDPFVFTSDVFNNGDIDVNAEGISLSDTPGLNVDQHAEYPIEETKQELKSFSDKSSPSFLFHLLIALVILLLIIALVVALLICCGLKKINAIPKRGSKEWCRIATLEKMYIYPIKSCGSMKAKKAHCHKHGLQCGYIKDSYLMVVDENKDEVSLSTFPVMVTVKPTGINSVLILQQPDLGLMEININEVQKSEPIAVHVNNVTLPAMDCGEEPREWFIKLLSTYHSGGKFNLVQCLTDEPYKNVNSEKHNVWGFSDGPVYRLINRASVEELNERLDIEDKVTVYNFRPNFVIEGAEPYDEDNWKYVKIGLNLFEILEPNRLNETVTINPYTGAKNPRREPLRTLGMYRQFEKSNENKAAYLGILMTLRSKSNTLIKINDIVFVIYKKGIEKKIISNNIKKSDKNNLRLSTSRDVCNVSSCSAVDDTMDMIIKQIITYDSIPNPDIEDASIPDIFTEERKSMREESSIKINALSILNSHDEKQHSHYTTDAKIGPISDNLTHNTINSLTVVSQGMSDEKAKPMLNNSETIVIKDVSSNHKSTDKKSYLITYSTINSKIFHGVNCRSGPCSLEDLQGIKETSKRSRELFLHVVSFDKLSRARSCLNFNELKKVLHNEVIGDFKVMSSHINCNGNEHLGNLTAASSNSVKDFADLKTISSLENNIRSKNEAFGEIKNSKDTAAKLQEYCEINKVDKETENNASKPGTFGRSKKLIKIKLDKITYAGDETDILRFLKYSDETTQSNKTDKSLNYPENLCETESLPKETIDTNSYTIGTVTPNLLSLCENKQLRMETEDNCTETKKIILDNFGKVIYAKPRDESISKPQKPYEKMKLKKYETDKDESSSEKASETKNISTEFEKVIYARKITASRLQIHYEEKKQRNEYEVDVDVTSPRKYGRTKDSREEKINKAICTKDKVTSGNQTYLF